MKDAVLGVPVDQHGMTGVLGDIADFAVEVEARHHTAGWDNTPPTLYRVLRDPSGYDIASARLGLQDIHPRMELDALAHAMECGETHGPIAAFLAEMYPTPPIAHLIAMEAWANSMAPEERERDSRMLADIPDSIEIRMVAGVVGKHYVFVRRPRGSEPEIMHGDAADLQGAMYEALCRIQRATTSLRGGS